jgi:uncharacterized repeat protein (TIGR02059 family)
MRNILIIIFLALTGSLQAATYYVATNGSDSNPGTLAQPWLTIQKGFSSIAPGDILYIRGGTYYPAGTIAAGYISGAVANGKKGSASAMYNVFAYPGEVPVMDCRNITNTSYDRMGIFITNSDYWYIKGIEVTRVDQPSGHMGHGVMIMSGNNNKIEAVVAHHNGGPGFILREQSEGNLLLNCDSYSNYDPLTSVPGDDGDGYDIGFITARSGNDRVNTLQGCRSWLNSDDGYDMYQYPGYHGIYILKDCWAWRNGYRTDGVTKAGDGNGFKYGADNNYSLDAVVRRTSDNCIAYANRQRGFSQEAANVKELFYNCTAYKNGTWGFSFYDYDTPDILRNNISYANPNGTIENQGSNRVHDHNSWDSKVTVSDADFVSLDAAQLANPRQADGNLPIITFLHLATGSDLIDAGVSVGLTYTGSAPDLGAFEVGGATTASPPVFTSASVENSAPSTLLINFDQILNTSYVPAASSFTVNVNSASRSITAVSVSGNTVSLTLSSAIQFGDVITASYTKPASNPIQNAGGYQAATMSAQSVSNNIGAPVPVFVKASVENSAPTVLVMTYSLSLANILPSASSFTVMVNSTRRSVSSVAISGTTVQLTLASSVAGGDVVTVAYTKPSSNPLQTASGGQAATLGTVSVTNNVVSNAPAFQSASIENTAPNILVMNYNMTMANVVPATSAFTVIVNSGKVTVSSIAITSTKVILTLATAVTSGDVVTVAYTKPSKNPLQSSAGAQAATISAQNVTNNVTASGPVYLSSSVENSTPKLLEITYNIALGNAVPVTSAFTVTVNASKRTISSVAISGSKVQLNLVTAIAFGDVITVAYTRPASNPVQSTIGIPAASLSTTAVTNNVTSTVPVYSASVIENAAPKVLVMTYNMALLTTSVPSASSFTVMVNSAKRTVSSVAVAGSNVSLTLSSAVVFGDVITVAYTKPSSGQIKSASGSQAASFGATIVTNNVTSTAPVYVSSVIQNGTPDILEITFSTALASITPSGTAFSVMVNSAAVGVTNVSVSGSKVKLTLSSEVAAGNIITVTYNQPSTNPLQTAAGALAPPFATRQVTNNVSAQANTPPTVSITYPSDNSTFTAPASFDITADATDSDGSVQKVDFYNGPTLIGTSQVAPYSYTFSTDVPGVYIITATATDNNGAMTHSAPVTVTVTDQGSGSGGNEFPVVALSNPTKGKVYDTPANVELDAVATDPDGYIVKIEFFSGNIKLAEVTSEPYTWVWKGVGTGTYEIRAVATDNQNASDTTEVVELVVGTKVNYDSSSNIINLYPNPSNGTFSIDFLVPLENEKNEIVISDMNGNEIQREPVTQEETTKEISMINPKTGIYILTLISNQILVTKKIIVR